MVMSIAMIFSFATFASAAGAPSGVIIPTPEEEEAYLQSLTEEDLAKIAAKEQHAQQVAEELANQPAPREVTRRSINFRIYPQEASMYCVPACVQSALIYINGSSPSQDKLATELPTGANGTDSTRIAPYMNSHQSFYYSRTAYPSQSTMCNNLYDTVENYSMPCFMSIGTSSNNWYYSTSSHCVIVYGVYSDKSSIMIADPLGNSGYAECPAYYAKNSGTVYNCNIDIVW